MNKRHIIRAASILLILIMTFSFFGCGKTGSTIDEPDEITVEYLYGEYADQILRDGGEVTLGTISVEQGDNNTYSAVIDNMVIVESDISESGYYIADTNVSESKSLDPLTRITYIHDQKTGPEIIELDEFIKLTASDSQDPDSEKVYDIYTIGDTVLMILAKELTSN